MLLRERIEAAITRATGEQARLTSSSPSRGGCAHDSRVVLLEDGRHFFVKTNADFARYPGIFESEFLALKLLAEPGVIAVPAPVAAEAEFLVVTAFSQGERAGNWEELMGRRLALLHQATVSTRFGFEHDNYLGLTPQPNGWSESWLSFWKEKRLGWQLELYAAKAPANDRLLMQGNRLLERLDGLLDGVDEPPVLLHGDLWSGNAAADDRGEPVIFDPASYYGHREAEIGMMRLFGGFGPRCEAAYHEVWPLAEGFEQRILLYRLYHELNHLNLFGQAYYRACLATLGSLLSY